jgi:hypothetical protein
VEIEFKAGLLIRPACIFEDGTPAVPRFRFGPLNGIIGEDVAHHSTNKTLWYPPLLLAKSDL